jgi:predicted GNAT family acetyltransferase
MTDSEPEVIRDDEHHRYQLLLDGHVVGFSTFRVRPGYLVFLHTETDANFEGRGFGSRLARGLLDEVRARGEKIKAECPFIAAYIKKHPEYEDLLVDA